MSKNLAIVLAAGKGSRMKSDIPKPLHLIDGKTMVYTLVEKLYNSDLFEKILVVIGTDSNLIRNNLDDFKSKIVYIIQKEQLGTGHAVMCCQNYLKSYRDSRSLILFADCPLLSIPTINSIVKDESECIACVCNKDNPFGNGRIILNKSGYIINSIEEKDCTPEQKEIKLVNVGIYMINNNLIINNIRKIKNNNSQNEYYLPDLMMILVEQEYLVIPKLLHNPNELINVNTQKDLLMANSVKRF
jgi:bifunctional UDP-N-acetylglucosamine pyrophosphorylase / glucosamine-1-phosphate N-acetyltransferase